MEAEIKKRLKWVRLYETCQDAGLVCLRCGISRPTLRKWLRRYTEQGVAGLIGHSRRPHSMPNRRVAEAQRNSIFDVTRSRIWRTAYSK